MTDRFDAKNSEHIAIKKGIELGDGIEAPLAGPRPAHSFIARSWWESKVLSKP